MTVKLQRGMWVANVLDEDGRFSCLGTVKAIYGYVDVVCYNHKGEKVGRVSPPEGGPTTFEPALNVDGLTVIEQPSFPLKPRGMFGWTIKPIGKAEL